MADAQLNIIAGVSNETTKIEAQIQEIARKLELHSARLIAVLWRKKSGTSYKNLQKTISRLAYDAGMCDENLMRLLFKLDGVLGEDEIRTQRKAAVVRIKDLIKRAEGLRQRGLRLERMLKKSANSVQWENAEEKKTEEAEAAAAATQGQQQSQSQNQSQEQQPQQAVPMETKGTAESPKSGDSQAMQDEDVPVSSAGQSSPQSPDNEKRAQSPAESKRSQASAGKPTVGEEQQQQAKPSPLRQQNTPKADEKDLDTSSDSEQSVSPAKSTSAKAKSNSKASSTSGENKQQKAKDTKPAVDFRTKYGKLPQWTPQFQEKETRDAVLVLADLDGVEDEDLTININEGVLTVRGVKKPTQEDLYYQRMFGVDPRAPFGWFERKFQIPESLNGDKATAEFRNGTLKITLPKIQQIKAAPRQAWHAPARSSAHRNPFWGHHEQEPEAAEEEDEESAPYPYALPRQSARPQYYRRAPPSQFSPFSSGGWGASPFGGFW